MDGLAGFSERGWARLTCAFDPSGLAGALWRELSAHGLRPGDPMTWRQAGSQPLAGKWLTRFGQSGVFAGVGSDAVRAALDELLGEGWTGQAGGWGRPLVTFPADGDWEIPASGWHLDSPPAPRLPSVRMFAYLSDVPERGRRHAGRRGLPPPGRRVSRRALAHGAGPAFPPGPVAPRDLAPRPPPGPDRGADGPRPLRPR